MVLRTNGASGTFNEAVSISTGGVVTIPSTSASASTVTGALLVGNGTSGGLGVGGAITLGGRLNAFGTAAALTHQVYVYNQLASATNAALSGAQYLAQPGYSTFVGTTGNGTSASYQGSIIGSAVVSEQGYVISDAVRGLLLHGVNGGIKFATNNPGTQAGSISNAGVWTIDATTDSTTKSDGALVVSGGVGVEKNIIAGSGIAARGTLTLPAAWTGSYGIGLESNNATATSRIFFGDGTGYALKFASRSSSATTDRMTLTDTGALTITGNLTNGEYHLTNGTSTHARSVYALSGTGKVEIGYGPTGYGFAHATGSYIAYADTLHVGALGAVSAALTLSTTGVVSVLNSTASTGTSSGALVVSGGVGVAKELYVGSATESNSNTTGGLVVSGGLGVALNLNMGGRLFINNTSAANGTLSASSIVSTFGADGVLGGLGFNVKGFPSATAGSRYIQLSAADSVDYREIRINDLGGNVLLGGATSTVKIGGSFQVGNAYVAGAPTATGYIVIKDSTGTSYKIPAQAL
jgi:hypothetical protein